jgi:hypothetical protein
MAAPIIQMAEVISMEAPANDCLIKNFIILYIL